MSDPVRTSSFFVERSPAYLVLWRSVPVGVEVDQETAPTPGEVAAAVREQLGYDLVLGEVTWEPEARRWIARVVKVRGWTG